MTHKPGHAPIIPNTSFSFDFPKNPLLPPTQPTSGTRAFIADKPVPKTTPKTTTTTTRSSRRRRRSSRTNTGIFEDTSQPIAPETLTSLGINTSTSQPIADETLASLGITRQPDIAKPVSFIQQTGKFEFPIFSIDGQNERLKNIADVLKISLNPLSKERITANVDNPLTKKLLELAANNPFQTAALVTGVVGTVRLFYGALRSMASTGAALESGQTTLPVGVVKSGARAIKNTFEAAKVTKIFADAAKIASPNNWRTLLGWGAVVATVGLPVYFSFTGTQNAAQDDFQQLSIGVSKLLALGDVEGALELREMMGDMKNFTDSIESKIPIYNYFKSTALEAKHFIRKTDLEIQATEKVAAESEITAQRNIELSQRIATGLTAQQIISDSEIKAFAENPDNKFTTTAKQYQQALEALTRETEFTAQDILRDEEKASEKAAKEGVDRERLQRGLTIAARILNDKMTASEIINDREIAEFALDPNNAFSAVTKIYNEAIAATGRGNFFGQQGGQQFINEPPTSLNFGLLQTSGTTRPVEGEEQPAQTQDVITPPPTSVDDDILTTNDLDSQRNAVAQQLFQTNYNQLSLDEREIVDDKI